jgi:hypothetical protein
MDVQDETWDVQNREWWAEYREGKARGVSCLFTGSKPRMGIFAPSLPSILQLISPASVLCVKTMSYASLFYGTSKLHHLCLYQLIPRMLIVISISNPFSYQSRFQVHPKISSNNPITVSLVPKWYGFAWHKASKGGYVLHCIQSSSRIAV